MVPETLASFSSLTQLVAQEHILYYGYFSNLLRNLMNEVHEIHNKFTNEHNTGNS
jgi:hypothetical protein